RARGVVVRTIAEASGGVTIEIDGGRTVQAIDERVPADPSAAAFWLVAASIHPDAELRLPGVGVNPTRRAAIDMLRAMGAEIAAVVAGLRALGADITVDRDDLLIAGPTPLRGATVTSHADHRLAMTFAIAGLVALGETRIEEASSAAISDPGFFGQLQAVGR